MGNKCCKNQSSTYSSAGATIRSFSSYNSSILRSGGSHAITFGTSTRAGDSLTTLTMKSSNHSDAGSKDYRGGSSSTIGQEDLIPIFLRRLNDLNIRVGTRTRFLIELDDATGVEVRWYHNNVEANSERYQYIHEGGFYCLDIVPVTLFDEGLWVCTAQNYAGKSSTAAHLSLTVPKAFKKPIFVEQLKAVLTQRGIVSLECKVIGVPTPKLRWYKDDKEIKAGDIFALTANSEEDCLGIYTCEATNVMGTALSTSKIQVTHTPLDGNRDADSLIPYGPPPKFMKFLKDASGKVGSVLFLECQVEVPPWPRSIGWYNDNGIVNEGPLYHLMADGLGMYGVEIKSLRADHSTTWKCIATSSTGAKAVTSCVVSVSYPKNYRVPRFLESLRAIMTDEGLVSFECKVIGYPTPQLSWFKDGKQLQPGDVYELTGSKSLGSYCCVARNCMGETSSIAELTIEDIQNQLNESEKLQLTSNTQPPRFLLGLKSIEANINESFVFTIKVTTESTPSISWYKEDEQLTESNRYQFSTEDNGTYMLSILPLEIDDQAEWKCVAINKYGQTVTSSFLKLNIPKTFKSPRFLEELRIAFSNEGSVNLECKVIGVPQPQLKWFKDGQELNPGDMHKIISGQSGTCCLGTYTCQAHNCMGTVSSSATLLTMEDKSTVKSCASEEYLSVGNPLVRNESLSTIPEERTSQMEKSYTIEEPADISFSFDGKEVTVSLYETPDLTHDEALQIIEMYADELSEHISEDNVVDLPSLRIVKESSISGPVMMEALVIDVPIDFCRQQIVSDTEFDGVSLTEDITLANNDKSDSIYENSLEYFSDHLSSGNSKREIFYSASETTPKNLSMILKQQSVEDEDEHQSFQTPKLFMSDSDDQILTQLKLDERISPQNSRHVIGPFARSESNNTEEEVSETLAEIENEPPLSHNYCASEIVTQSEKDGLYSTVLNKIQAKGMASVALSSEEDDVLKIISRPNVDEFLKYMKIILEGAIVKMQTHENFNITSTTTELERSIQALHSLAWKFIEEMEKNNLTDLDKNTADNVSSLMTAINASLLALEQIDDPFGVSDNVLNEIQSSVCFDLETLNNNDLPASVILDRLSDQIKNFTIVVNRQVTRVTEQRIIAVLRNTIGTSLVYIKTLQQNNSKIKCVDMNLLAALFSMVQPLETILNDIALIEESSIDDNKPNLKLKQILIPPISSIAFALDNLNTALKSDSSNDDHDLKDIYDKINKSTNQFMIIASQGMDSNKIAECFISFTKPINDLCCHLRRLGRSTENIVSSDYGSDDKLLLDFETLFDELMMDIDTLINNVNFVQDSENNMNPLGSLLEPLQDMKIGLFQVNQVLLSNQTGSTMSYEVVSCFEHLSQQLVQLNNCIVNQSIIEETDKEIPFESSIKMMQNILFDDAIDDLGVNGILFSSVMKPLLQLQNLIVSKMASVESDLSFSEHTDVTGGACDTQSLSLSLSNNAQTVFNKTIDENSKNGLTESSIIDKDCDKQKDIHTDYSEINKDSIHFENNVNNDLVIKKGFECDIGETFKYEEPNIITSEDDRDNSGFEALFYETDLETISDFVEDRCMDNIINSKVDHKLSDLFMVENDIEMVQKEINDNIPEHLLESLEKNNQQDLILNSPVDLFDELQETLKNMSEVAQDKLTGIYALDNNTSSINGLQKHNSKYDDQLCDKTNKLLDNSLDVAKSNNSIIIRSDELTKQNIIELSEINSEESNQCNKIILKTDQNETLKNKDISVSDQDIYKEGKVFEIEQVVDLVDNFECLDSDKSISNNTIITVNEISESSEVKIKEVDNTENLETTVNLISSTTGNVSQIVDVSDENSSLITSINNVVSKINDNDEALTDISNIKNEILDSALLNKLNFTESTKNIKYVSNEDIMIDTNKLNDSEKLNLLNYDYDTENKDKLLTKKIDEPSITENFSHNAFQQNNTAINDIDSIHNLGTDMAIQVAQTSIGNEVNTDKDNKLIPMDISTNSEELNKALAKLVDEKNDLTLATNLLIEDRNTSIINETSNEIKQCDNKDLINKNNCTIEERETSTKEPTSSIDSINLMTVMENNIIKSTTEIQDTNNEKLSLVKYEYNDSGAFEIDQNDSDNISHHDMQPNINTTSTTDNKLSVSNSPINENIVNPITEPNVHQTEEYVQNSSNQFIDEIQNQKNENELINEESIENAQQKCFNVQQTHILELSNNEVKAIDELNEQCEILSEMKLNNEIEYINSKIVLSTDIIFPENVVEQCVLDKSNHVDGLCTTQYTIDKCADIILPITEVMTEKTGSNILDKQLVITSTNVEQNKNEADKSKQNIKLCENSSKNNEIIDNTGTKFKTDVTNIFENSVHLTLNEEEMSSDKKINSCSENEITEISMNNEEKYINTLNKSLKNTSENTQPIDSYTFEENRVEIQFKDNINSRNEHTTVLDDKDKIISNLELLESKNEVLYFPDETINNDDEKSCGEMKYIQNDSSKIINELPNIIVEHTTALICNEIISASNVELMDSVVIDFENIKEQYEIELNVPDSKNIEVLENTIDTIDKINRQNDDEEKVSNGESISKLLNTDNLIYDENNEKSITKEYNEIQTSKLIDEKSNSDSYIDDVKNSNDILKAMNNLNTENKERNILTKSQPSDENGIKVSLTENDLITTIIDMETTKTKTDNEVDSCKTITSENDLAKHKSSFLVIDNTEDCKEITSYPNMYNEISNKNNINQPKHLTECQTKAILENFDTLKTDSCKETELSNKISNEEKSSRIVGDLEINETSECLLLNKDIYCKIMERPNIDFSVDESSQSDTDIVIIAQQNITSKTETPDVSVYSTEKVNVMTKDNPDKNHSVESNLTFEVQGNSSYTINDNEENEHSIIKLESINADEDILINEVKINNQIDIMTAVENNVNLLNDTIFEDGVDDLSAKESLSTLSIVPKLHCIEKIAANQTECVMLENTNLLKQNELNVTENVNQYAQVEHELNIAAIGNIIIDYDSIKEHSITSDDEKNSIENATMALNLDDHSFKIVSTIVDVLNAPTNDMIINNEQTVMNEVSKDSIGVTTLLSENKNPENLMAVILNDETENSNNFVKENVQSKIESMNKPTEILNNDTYKQSNLVLKHERNDEVVDELQQSLKKSNQIFESLVLSIDANDTTREIKSDVSIIENIKTTIDEKTTDTKDEEDIKQKLNSKSIESPSTFIPTNNISVKQNKINTTEIINKTLEEKNVMLSDENKNTEKVKTELILKKVVKTDDKNKNIKNNEIDNNGEKLNEDEIELNKTKRGSKKKKSSLPSEDKKSPSPDKTINDVIVTEKEIDKTKNIETSNVEKNKILSDDNNDTEKVEVELSKSEPTIPLDNNQNTEEVIEKDVLIDDQNQNQKDNKIDNGDIQFSESEIELNKPKRGSEKKKPTLQSEDKKSPSSDKTINDVIVTEKEIDKTKIIDTSIEEKNKILSDDNNDTEKVEVELSKSEPTIPLDNNQNTEEVIEKDVLIDDQNQNQKDNKIDNGDIQFSESEIEINKLKRGSKKKKPSLPSEDKKAPSPDKTKNDIIDKTKNIETSNVEKNKILSDDNNDTEKVEVELSKSEPTIPLDNNQNTEEVIEKDVLIDDQNQNQKDNKIDNGDIQFSESEIELNKPKRGSEKKKPTLQSEDKKSPSSDKTINDVIVTEKEIDKTKIIDKSIEEKNKILSDDNNDTEKVEVELSKSEPTIPLDNNQNTEEVIEKDVLIDDQNQNQKDNKIDNGDIQFSESEIEINKPKRGSKKKKPSLPSEDKKAPLPDKTKNDIIDKTKNIDKSIEEKNKILSDDNNDTEKVEVELSKSEPTIPLDNNQNTDEVIEKDVLTDEQNKNQKYNKIDNGDIQFTEDEIELNKTKRGSKKKKPSLPSEDKKASSPDKTKNIDKSIEEKNKILSDDKNYTEKVKVELSKLEPTIPLDNNKNTDEVIEKDVLTDDQNKRQKNDKINIDDNIKSTENNVELVKTKRESKKNESRRPVENKKSHSPEKTKNILSDNNNDTEKLGTKLEVPVESNIIKAEEFDYEISIEDTKQKNEKEFIEKNIENDEKKRGSKKNKISPEPEKKISSPDTTKNNISVIENKINTIIIDETFDDNDKQISEDNNHTEQVGTEVKSKTITGNNKNIAKKIEKDVSNNTQIKNQNNDDIGKDEIKSTENCVEKDGTKRGRKSSRPEGKKTTSPDKTNEITEHLKIQSRDKNNAIIELKQLEKKRDESKILRESKQTLQCKEIEPSPTSQKLSINNYESIDSCQSKISSENNSRVGMNRKQMNETRYFVDVLVDDGGQRVTKNELKSTGLAELDNVGVPEIPNFDKRPVNRYILDVTDAHKLRPNTLAYRSLTPDPLTSYKSPTSDHLTSYRSLTPDCPSYKSYLTPRSKYTASTRYAGSSDRELYGGSSSSRSSRSSSRSMSPYPSESRISTRNLWPTSIAAYRCLSETSVPLSPRFLEEEKTSGWSHTSYGATTRRRRGSDSFLHDSGVRDGDYYSSWRLSNSRSAAYGVTEDLCRTKEAFKGLYFCVRMIDQTVSSGARVKFWCSVIGHPEPRVQWYRDGQKLNSFTYNSSARYQTKYDGGLAQLIIDNAQSGDSGEYTCVAANSSDRISTTGFLTVYTSPSVFRKPLLQPSLSVDSFESGCGAYSRTSHNLRLPANAKFDFGCRKFGSDLVCRRPEYPKFVSSIIADDVATCGGTIALQVRVQGSPVPNVTWMRESRPLPRLSGKYVYLDEGGLYTLLVMDSTARDGGTYVCRACNLYGVADAEKAVSVVSPQDYSDRRGVKPAIIVSRPNDRLNVAVGEDITVTLRVAGEPKPKVIWMRGSRDVTFFDRSSKETINDYVMLSIKKAQPSDAGTYFIIAKNVYGSDRAFVTVGVRERARSLTPPRIRNTIGRWSRPIGGRGGRGGCANNEVPGPIRSEPTVTDQTNNRISLQWDRPEKPETVLVYRVETRSADEECWRPVGMTPTNTIDVYNLKPGYRYQFRVAARNRFGWSQSVAAKGYVDVFEPKCLPEFRQPLSGQTRVLLHHSATLQCHVRGVPEPRVTWFKDGEPLLASDRHAVRRTDTGKCTLTIEDAVEEDAGRYSCEAVNDQGRVCTLTVVQVIANRRIVEAERRLQGCLMKNNNFKESAPVFTKHLIDRRVEINSTVRLSCQVNGLPVPLVLWYKDGQPLDFSGGTEGDRKPPVRDDSDDFYTLELTGVKYDDSGAYAAVASNAIGKASTRCVLEVFNKNRTDPAVPTFIFGLPTTSEAVDSIVLSAQIDAFRPVKVEWFRDGIQLRNGRRVDIITDHDGNLELRIACVTTRDSGTYMLRVSNDTGTVESRCDVNVVEREHNDVGMEQISLINHLYSKKPKFVVKPKFQEVEEGQEVIIDSEIVGDPLPKITWLRDGLKPGYYRDNSEFLCISNGNRYQLKIPHAKLTHTGTYTLLAANPHGQIKALISLQVYSTGHCKKKMENGTNHATVERLPRISRGLVDIECRENDGVTFECKLNITQETDIRWQKDGKLVRLGKQIKSQLIDGDTARLEISTVSPLHEGLYTCTAFNELGQDSTSARLILLSDSQETAKIPQSNGQQNTMIGSPILAGESNDRCTKRLKRSSAPKFYAVLHDRIADIGETVRFQCSVSGHPPPWSSWEKDGQPIGVNSRMRIREDDDYRSLEICDVTSDDAGLYRITVENKFGKIQATARLEVLTHNQITNDVQITSSSNGRRQSGSAACTGENFTLSCDLRGNSMSDVTWYKNDVEVKPGDRVTSSLDNLAARLSISNLESADTGVYTCVARCESGVTRCSTELCVFDTKPGTDSYLQPPIFVEGLVPKRTADEGEPVQLTVRLQGAVPMSALWFKNDVLVPDCADFEYVVTEDRGEFGLSIIDPFVKDSGIYSCKVANSFGQAVSSGKLVINEMSSENQVPMVIELNNNLQDVGEKTACDSPVNTKAALPASILSGPCDTTVLRGAKVVLKTSYKGDPEPSVQWLRAGKVLESDAHLCITNERGVSSLTIDSITADDCGKYVVRVDNGHGNDFHFASVAVEGPPDPPAGRPVVSVSETSADVTWSSPAYDGGCMVTGYGVEVRPFNQSDWKLVADKCHSLSHIVRGLAPGESYVFRVRAENMHGSSEASLESTPVYILQTDYGNTLWPKTVNIENGDLFDKQYEMLDELGKGRYGVVYKVKERETNKYYAAKFVRCIKSTDKEKAQEEVDIMNCLRHPKLLQLDAAFDKPREVVLVTEYISGGELFERVVADDFTLTEKDCILFTRQICEGVDYMHKQNVVHLDLKPENIMCQSRTSHYIKLIDFGLAQKIIPGQPMRVLFGTPEFIPPEIIGYEPIGFESDMWSVGVICYVLLSGLSPFMGDNDSETFTNITKAEFDFDDEAFDAVSQDAKDFISALLIKRKELRLTARECLKHKWLAQQDMDMSCVILSTDKLKKFIIRRKWQKTGNAIRALGRMATLSAASRRGVVGGGSAGGGVGGGTADGNGARSILQKLKMTSLREEESTVESPSEGQEMTITETTKIGSCHKACDDRSDSGFSECPSVASPTAMLIRTPECPSVISKETPPVSNQDRSPPPPTRRSSPTITDSHSSPANLRPSSPAARRTHSPANRCPSTSTTCSPSSPPTHGSSPPATRGPSSPAVRGPSYPATRGYSHTTHPRSPLLRNRHDTSHPIHDVPLPTGTGVSVLKTNRMIFDGGRRDGSASSAGMSVSGGVQRKEPIRIQTADNFKKAVAFWKQ
ncbi:uncharacterized protein LOC113550868 isoform X2 [Rhopalosiphum maidis]|uniref:uncharacterized protein LOC113550868 isoform X2 n=1 Tax=Rhopalosiphum maidis TaxID=43146 RepID=UPI000EFE6B2D|nr:uncharacterized protein LOC113550868 isoform X2 [Rhopalosiphum maidis]